MLEEIRNIKSGKKELREFGLTIGVILVILGAVALWRNKVTPACYFLGIGGLLVVFGLALPKSLKPLQKSWMSFSIFIGFFVSRFVLSILFYAVFAPVGLIARLFGKDILDQRIDDTCQSYWQDKESREEKKESYENQY
ncbi:MAG: hypothetical protein A2Z72_05615 [Omnitrophica bacterium RBG_13_46_9]|nr:MAG: hypothetical protein A2Z72_05615 [Omnitrophica bacterium RBG_13_46_9]